jgi:hypothetical protein
MGQTVQAAKGSRAEWLCRRRLLERHASGGVSSPIRSSLENTYR